MSLSHRDVGIGQADRLDVLAPRDCGVELDQGEVVVHRVGVIRRVADPTLGTEELLTTEQFILFSDNLFKMSGSLTYLLSWTGDHRARS